MGSLAQPSTQAAAAQPADPPYLHGRQAAQLFFVFALGYFLSAMLRAVTATLAPVFSAELMLSAADLGLLAGAYFVGFSLMQLPVGSALDRYGSKRVLSVFLLVAVLACVAFATAEGFLALVGARGLIGVGVAACLMAPLTRFRKVFSPGLQMRTTSWMLTAGSMGMLSSTLPVHALLPVLGWRGLFWCAALGFLLVSLLVMWVVPSDRAEQNAALQESDEASGSAVSAYRQIFTHPTFVRFMPMGLWHYGGLVAVQTLWAGPWLTQVSGLSPQESATGLFLINLTMLIGFATLGAVAPRLLKCGWHAHRLIAWSVPLSVVMMVSLCLRGQASTALDIALWCLSCVLTSLTQPALGQAFKAALVGRALSAYNLVIFSGVFILQWGLGALIDRLKAAGLSAAQAFQASFGLFAIGCVLSYLWFLVRSDGVSLLGPMPKRPSSG